MKILKSKKALSPVVASIILIAVTVAVSIAVAAWMGALTIGFMGSSSLTITNVNFTNGSGTLNNTIVLTVKNTGTKQVTVAGVKVNSLTKTAFSGDLTLAAGDTGKTITVYMGNEYVWTDGSAYQIELYDSSGQPVGSTQKNAP